MQPKVKQELESRVLDTGDVMTGNLEIRTPIDMIPNFRLIPSNGINGSTHLYKNTSSIKDYGTHLVDSEINGDSVRLSLIASKINDFSKSIYFNVKKADGTTIDYPIYHTGYKPTPSQLGCVAKSGDTMTGALNFANGTMNLVGDDCYFGDNNVAGAFCIKGNNGNTQLRFIQYGGTNFASITYDGSSLLNSNTNFRIQNSSPSFQLYHSGKLRLGQIYIDDSQNFLILNWKDTNSFTQLGVINETLGTNDILHCYRKTSSTNLEDYIVLHSGNYYNYTPKSFYRVLDDFDKLSELGYNACNFTSAATAGHFIIGREWGWNTDGNNFGMQLRIDGWTGKLYTRSFGGWGPAWSAWKYHWQEGDAVTSAVWNDYAEYREADVIEPGYVLVEKGDDTLTKSSKRLSHFYGVSSDTWGFSQGETEKAKTPIAVAGRVLVYPFQKRENYEPGQCVCAGPGGMVDIMTEEEVMKYPDKIVGVVSCVPNYDTWGGGENADREPVKVNGRIWIKVK